MNVNNMTKYAVGLLVGLVMIAGLLVPIVNDAEHVGAASYSNGTHYAKEIKNNELNMIVATGTDLVSNGDIISDTGYYAILSDTFGMYWGGSACNIFWNDGATKAGWSAIAGANISIDGATKTITLSDIAHAGANDNISGNTLEINYNESCYYRAKSGEYCITTPNGAYTNSLDNLYGFVHAGGAQGAILTWQGTEAYVNGVLSSVAPVITSTEIEEGVIELETLYHSSKNAAAVVVPNIVYGDGLLESSHVVMLGIIPLLAIVALVIFAASAIRGRV